MMVEAGRSRPFPVPELGMTQPHDEERASAREDLARFLAACYYEPDPAFAEERLFDSILAAATALGPALQEPARRVAEAFAQDDLQNLLLDYSRLFLGPTQPLASPYGSLWLSGEKRLMDATTAALLALYREAGFELSEEFRDLPDHVAVELEFLYTLLFFENQARRSGHTGELHRIQGLKARLLHEHLGAWVDRFAAAVAEGARTAFYRELAGLTASFVRQSSDSAGVAAS
jgi:putative dimethyl sulfoxide reductase chaperone